MTLQDRGAYPRPTEGGAYPRPSKRGASSRPSNDGATSRPTDRAASARPSTRGASSRPSDDGASSRALDDRASARPSDPGVTRGPDAPDAGAPAPTFADLRLDPALLAALRSLHHDTPTPIQAEAIPYLLDGRDLLGVAQTGTGKTAAFALPILHRFHRARVRGTPRRPRALVLTPTRELAAQIGQSFAAYGRNVPVRGTVVFGGVGQGPQVSALLRGVEVLVATPGRLLDLVGQRHVDLAHVEVFVLDEADRMLDMGFLRDVRRVMATLPAERQSLLFSATMPADIVRLSRTLLRDPVRVEVAPPSSTVERVDQHVHHVAKQDKRALLSRILDDHAIQRALVFTRTKHGADKVCRHLESAGVRSAALHGNKSQGARQRALDAFRAGRLRALVATDIAARGLDVPGITHVINFDLPNVPESYVHRIGRTARAGRDGVAISFCDASERGFLADIQREIRQELVVVGDAPPPAPFPLRPTPAFAGRAAGASRTAGASRGARRFGRSRPRARW